MDKEIRKLIELNLIRDIQIEMLKQKKEGMIINEEIINKILKDLEEGEVTDCTECGKEHDESKSCLEAGAVRLNV